jgi:hypothetical protein
MNKIIILIEPVSDWLDFEQRWPEFLSKAELMPGLIRETTSPIHHKIAGNFHVSMIHELYFDSMSDLKVAMNSDEGKAAGEVLQKITQGNVTLLFADHLEDEIKNIQAYQKPEDASYPGNRA